MKPRELHILVFILMLPFCEIHTQERNIFLEIGGSGGLGSLNYEHAFPRHVRIHNGWDDDGVSKLQYSLRFGLGLSPIDKNNGWVLVFPVMGNVKIGGQTKVHFFELGAGLAPSVTTKGAVFIKSPVLIGYRYEPNRWFLRVSYTPIFAWLVDVQWQHWAGVSVGLKLIPKNEAKVQ